MPKAQTKRLRILLVAREHFFAKSNWGYIFFHPDSLKSNFLEARKKWHCYNHVFQIILADVSFFKIWKEKNEKYDETEKKKKNPIFKYLIFKGSEITQLYPLLNPL